MALLDDLAYRLRSLLKRSRQESELDEELRFHLEMEIDRRVAAGEDRVSAERAARLDFGAPESVKEAVRDAWGTRLLEETWRDSRAALRHFVKAPAFSLAAIGSLTVGLGAAAVIFSLVDAVLLRPLPYGEPERIVAFYELTPQGDRFSVSDQNLLDFRREISGLSQIAAIAFPAPRPALGGEHGRKRLEAQAVSPSFFSVLGVEARWGRTFDVKDEKAASAPREVVITDRAWRRYFGARESLLGELIDLDGDLYTVIGILPEDFHFGMRSDIFLPYVVDPELARGDHRLTAFARLAPGVSFDQASDQTAAVAARLAEEYPKSNANWSAELAPIEEFFLGADDRRLGHVLIGAVFLLLLLAAVNVSSLLLARAADRGHEMRLRLALGAGRGRLVRQLMTEALWLGVLGALGGLAVAYFAVPIVGALEFPLPRLDEMRFDARVFAFLAAAGLLSSLLFGPLPALRVSRRPAAGLNSRRQGSDPHSQKLRSMLVVGEVALATILTLGAGLLLHSFGALTKVDTGFANEADQVLLGYIDLPMGRYTEGSAATRLFYRDLVQSLENKPGIESVGLTTTNPFYGPDLRNNVAPEEEKDQNAFVPIHWRAASTGIFRTLGIPILRGRSFVDGEEPRSEAVISAGLAARLWPGEDPIGRRLRWISPQGPAIEVVGVVGEVRDIRLMDPEKMTVYLPQPIMAWPTTALAVKGSLPTESLQASVRATLQELDPLLAMAPMSTLGEQRREALGQPLLGLGLLSIASALALALAAIGVYGLLAYALSQRRREMGLRVALGARPAELMRLIAGGGLRLVGLGLACGIALSFALAESLRSLLYSTSPFEPSVIFMVMAVLILVGLASSGLPALRAARLDPLEALRED